MNYVDPEGLWSKANLGYQAQAGDTLWGLAEEVFQGQGWKWRDLGYPYDVNKRPLQEGDIIAYQGGLIEYENGVPYIHVAHVVYENNGYHTPEKMPDPPEPKPQEPTASGGGTNSKPGSVSSTSKPGNVNASGMTSGGLKPGGGSQGVGLGKNEPSLDFYGPPLPPVFIQHETISKEQEKILSDALHATDAILNTLPHVDMAEIGGYLLDFEKIGETYHARFDCWQSYFGYNDLYDFFFDLGTSMDSAKFEFKSGRKEYVLWAWKGDYISLGAGAEMGIYERATFLGLKLPHWNVKKDLAMKMSLQLYYNGRTIIDYAPKEKQWWITGFNPNYKNVKAGQLTAVYTVTFNTKTMYNDFLNSKGYKKNKSKWTTAGKNTLKFTF